MKERISTLMDGELYEEDASVLLGKIKASSEAQQDWRAYHLIGDVLRQPDHIPRDISAALHERLQAEPVVLAPRARFSKKIGYIAMSAAATVSAVGVVVWMALQIQSEPVPLLAAQKPAGKVAANSEAVATVSGKVVAGKSLSKEMDDYLMAHQEVSPSTEVAGGTTYIHTVSAR